MTARTLLKAIHTVTKAIEEGAIFAPSLIVLLADVRSALIVTLVPASALFAFIVMHWWGEVNPMSLGTCHRHRHDGGRRDRDGREHPSASDRKGQCGSVRMPEKWKPCFTPRRKSGVRSFGSLSSWCSCHFHPRFRGQDVQPLAFTISFAPFGSHHSLSRSFLRLTFFSKQELHERDPLHIRFTRTHISGC
jgi:hypothetical protein